MDLNASTDSRISAYLSDVVAWHGHVSLLGLPTLQLNADIQIGDLYVPHSISDTRLDPTSDPNEWKVYDPAERLALDRKLVLLGDPGAGKSTLLNWFAWYLASGFERRLPEGLDGVLPLPIVLREVPGGKVENLRDLVILFLAQPVARSLVCNPEVIEEYLSAGRVLFLIDGLDEVPPAFGAAVHKLVVNDDSDVYFLLTSRIVGYSDDVAPLARASGDSEADQSISAKITVGFVAPFNDVQISVFAENWYRERSFSGAVTAKLGSEFTDAIMSDGSILALARTPNLLTMMAIVYRGRAKLPNGRALLYDDIAQAYLESIDSARRMKDEYSWKTKRAWLGRIAFEMQLLRSKAVEESGYAGAKELLVDRSIVLTWLREAIYETQGHGENDYAERYLDWIARRSGLLLPRAEGKFSFLHLSFQEYFAARHVKACVQNPFWPGSSSDRRVTRKKFIAWYNQSVWNQVFVFLFELSSGEQGWIEKLFSLLRLPALDKRLGAAPAARLMCALLANPHVVVEVKARRKKLDELWPHVLHEQTYVGESILESRYGGGYQISMLVSLLSSGLTNAFTLDALERCRGEILYLILDHADADVLYSIRHVLHGATGLKVVSLCGVSISSCEILHGLKNLEVVSLRNSKVSDIGELVSSKRIRAIFLDRSRVEDLSVLSGFDELEVVDIDFTEVSSIEPIAGCLKIKSLSMERTQVFDLSPLSNGQRITGLDVSSTGVVSLEGLDLSALRMLEISNSRISDISPLANSKNLVMLAMVGLPVEDASVLANCVNLRVLLMNDSKVSSLDSLSNCKKLIGVAVSGTPVSDVSPLGGHPDLMSLFIDHTSVTDLSPLRMCPKLTAISTVGCSIEVPM
ncbi:TPA: NACHT domain-containing protein [Stenotrophomonas maltophilia]|nr:NACHT domain-containing protein [Stenotrophomonas maltophilia]